MRRFGYVVLAIVAAAMTGCGPAGTPAARSSTSAGTCASGLPGDGLPPPPLPADRPVGRGKLIYQPCPDCGAWLVVLERIVDPGSPSPGANPTSAPPDPVRLFLMDTVTGERRPSCTLPANSEVILPA